VTKRSQNLLCFQRSSRKTNPIPPTCGRLKAASEGAALGGGTTCPTTQSWCQENGFDPFGNRWVSFSNRTLHMATPTSAAAFNGSTNRLTGSGITYDNAGNLTAHPFLTPGAGGGMVYNASNKMTQFTATGVSVSYRYDASERRVRQDSGGQTTIWVYDAFGQLAAEYSTNLTMVQGVYYRTTDHLGSTRIVTNQSAAVVQRRDFFPFGEAIPADSSHGNRQAVTDGGQPTYNSNSGVKQQFTGQQHDEETGLDYFWARNYSSNLGRFLSVDPQNAGAAGSRPQSWNAFAYVENSPCNLHDPTGLQAEGPPFDPDFYLRDLILNRPKSRKPTLFEQIRFNLGVAQDTLALRTQFSQNCTDGLANIGVNGKPLTPQMVLGAVAELQTIALGTVADLSIQDAYGQTGAAAVAGGSAQRVADQRNQGYLAQNGLSHVRVVDTFVLDNTQAAYTPFGGNTIYIQPDRFLSPNNVERNMGFLMHEALHNSFGLDDGDIMKALGLSGSSKSITNWLTKNCIRGKDNR
jgi:RHS repeat-associated protein